MGTCDRLETIVVAKLVNFDTSCKNNHKHRVKMDKIFYGDATKRHW
jgi:hypothetical protein